MPPSVQGVLAPAITSTFSTSNSEDPAKLPTEKFSPGAWLSIASITCKDSQSGTIKSRVLMILNPITG